MLSLIIALVASTGFYLSAPVELKVEQARPACCIEVRQLPAQQELRVINNYGMQPFGKEQ